MEEKKTVLSKGGKLEELLREFYLQAGYYVARGVKFKYDDVDVTDVDLWLYKRVSQTDRSRGNVDIKSKKSPQAIERIFWAKGVKDVLNLDYCVVVTPDRRDSIQRFGLMHKVIIIDGNFISKLVKRDDIDRITEEEFISLIETEKENSYKGSWKYLYENAKSRLINELDFSGCNATLIDVRSYIEKFINGQNNQLISLRMIYYLVSVFLVILDYISKDLVYLENDRRYDRLLDGFKFGNLGRKGVQQFLDMAIYLTGNDKQPQSSINAFFDDQQAIILAEFFSENKNVNILFRSALAFERLAFTNEITPVNDIDSPLKEIISVILDYLNVDRRRFFSAMVNK